MNIKRRTLTALLLCGVVSSPVLAQEKPKILLEHRAKPSDIARCGWA